MLLFRMPQIQRFGKADFGHVEKGKAKATTVWMTTKHTNHTKISFSVAKPSQKIRLSVLLPSPLLFSVFRGFLAPSALVVGCFHGDEASPLLSRARHSSPDGLNGE
jgi:hypothetical protein